MSHRDSANRKSKEVWRSRHRKKSRRWQMPGEDDWKIYGLVYVVIYNLLGSIAQCTMPPVTGGEDPMYDRDEYR